MKTVAVYLRNVLDLHGEYLCDWPADDIANLLHQLKTHSVFQMSSGETCEHDGQFITQFVVDTERRMAFFEIVLDGEER